MSPPPPILPPSILPSLILRDATEDDLPAIVDIYNSTIPARLATADTTPVTIESRRPWFHAHNPRTRPIWVAENPNAAPPATSIAAWFSLNTFFNGRPAYDGTAEVSIYIAEKHRRAGLGAWLLSEAIARAPACGITTLVANIFGHNEPSLRLAKKHGFETWGYLPRVAVVDGTARDLAILGKRLKD
jgi:phosphinothricin acetyltransferase